MVAEPRKRRFWLETALVFTAWAIFGLLLANQSSILSTLGGRQMPLFMAHRARAHRRHGRVKDSAKVICWQVTTGDDVRGCDDQQRTGGQRVSHTNGVRFA